MQVTFTFKIKTLCSYICTEGTAGEENVRYIHNKRHCTLVHEQKGLEYVTKIEHDMKTTDLFNTFLKNNSIFFISHVI